MVNPHFLALSDGLEDMSNLFNHPKQASNASYEG